MIFLVCPFIYRVDRSRCGALRFVLGVLEAAGNSNSCTARECFLGFFVWMFVRYIDVRGLFAAFISHTLNPIFQAPNSKP